jgi:hypothetical protein
LTDEKKHGRMLKLKKIMLITQIFQNNKKLTLEKGNYGFYQDAQEQTNNAVSFESDPRIEFQRSADEVKPPHLKRRGISFKLINIF